MPGWQDGGGKNLELFATGLGARWSYYKLYEAQH
jgi:hypothetical protein